MAPCFVYFFILFIIAISCHPSSSYENLTLDNVSIDLGSKEGLSKTSTISGENLKKILAGVENGNSDNIYYYGLLKLYGISVGKDLSTASNSFLRASELGHLEATTAYGVMLMTGQGMTVDYAKASQFFRKAIAMDDMNAYWLLGKLLMEGKVVSSGNSFVEAALLMRKAADAHVPQAEHLLGLMFEYGRGVPQSFESAAKMYRRATEQNHIESAYNLAMMYAFGRGVPQDFARARPLLELGAAADHAPSLHYIGIFKTYGYGCDVDYEQAANWFERAAALKDPRVRDEAYRAMVELRTLLDKAYAANEEVVAGFMSRTERD